jgi:hypothetical protein
MNQAKFHPTLVISLWCGAVPSQHTLDFQLRDIWVTVGDSSRVLKGFVQPTNSECK